MPRFVAVHEFYQSDPGDLYIAASTDSFAPLTRRGDRRRMPPPRARGGMADALDLGFGNHQFQGVSSRYIELQYQARVYWIQITFTSFQRGIATPSEKTMKVAQKVAQLFSLIFCGEFQAVRSVASVGLCF